MPRSTPCAMASPIEVNLLPPLPTAPHSAEDALLARLRAALETLPLWPLMPAWMPCASAVPMLRPLAALNSRLAASCALLVVCVVVLTSALFAFCTACRSPVIKSSPISPPAVLFRISAAAASASSATTSTAALTVSLPPVMPVAISSTAAS